MKILGKILLVIVGVFYVMMGFSSLLNPARTLVSLSVVWSAMTFVGGISSIAAFFVIKEDVPGKGFILLSGILQAIMGFMLISNGALFTTIVALNVLQIWTIFSGVTFIVDSFEYKSAGVRFWWLRLLLGILCLIVGMSSFSSAIFNTMLCAQFVGAGLMSVGIAFIFGAFAADKGSDKNAVTKA